MTILMLNTHKDAWRGVAYAGSVFYVVYTLNNLYADVLYHHVGLATVATAWDAAIAFVPSMILIYALSLPLFIFSFFVISPSNIARLAHRLILMSLSSGLIFYFFPLYFSFERNDFNQFGIDWSLCYQILSVLDKPFNQLPSLHVGFAVLIFLSLYDDIRKVGKLALSVFFVLCLGIAISTLLTYQHHGYDVIFGLIVALAIYYFETYLFYAHTPPIKSSIIKYLSVGVIWFLLLATLPIILNHQLIFSTINYLYLVMAYYGLMSFLLVAYCYHYYKNPMPNHWLCQVFKKSQGIPHIRTWFLFFPLLMIYHVMWQLARQTGFCQTQKKPIKIKDNLSIMATGQLAKDDDFYNTLANYYHQVIWIDVAAELSNHGLSQYIKKSNHDNLIYVYFPMIDLAGYRDNHLPMLIQHCQAINNKINDMPTLIICQCAMGRSRSVVIMGYLLAYLGQYTPQAIMSLLDSYLPNHHAKRYLDNNILTALSHANHHNLINNLTNNLKYN